ncbi:lactonase family protein [Pendulispora albinea]|uniref:Lactonase family protein n=1 Tax=Pendulispora albinea TaxID=2741071 RepID=A0ABZ2M1Z9_9BACT
MSEEKEGRGIVKRRQFLAAVGIAGIGGALWARKVWRSESEKGSGVIYIGGYSTPSGLTIARLDEKTGALIALGQVPDVPKASWFAYSADRRFLYLTNEFETAGQLTALDVSDPKQPKVLGTQPSRGAAPTHVTVHPSGRHLLTANYGDATVAVHRIEADGRIGESTDLVRQTGTQREAHAHQVLVDPSGKWVLVVDLGADSVFVYAFDPAAGKLKQHAKVTLPTGTGPRHLAFHPTANRVYILGELVPVVTVATWDDKSGELTLGQVVGTVAPGTTSTNYPGEIAISSDGKFVYASNRGENSIATFAVQDQGARLEFLGTTPTGGNWPRHFVLSPDEHWMYVSNQRSNSVTWLPRDPTTGRLGSSAGSLEVQTAAIVSFR